MTLKSDLKDYRERWKIIEEVQAAERRAASMELRWRQLNAAYGMAKSLGLLRSDPSEYEVYSLWAMLKEKILNPPKLD